MTEKAPVALTCGEPAGIGPEITAKAWEILGAEFPFFLIGDAAHLPPGTPVSPINDPRECARAAASGVPILHHEFAVPVAPGQPELANAQTVVDVIARACSLVMQGQARAMCTNPIHKKALIDGAGFAYPGHTEYLAALAGADRGVMMLACDTLRVVPATIHIPLSQVAAALSPELLHDTIRITHDALVTSFGITEPRIAVAGLNPHAGEGGTMGREEIELIAPVIDSLRATGMIIAGPLSADTMFHARARAAYDAAITMYHDQALIPIKTLAFDQGVNVTLGLPFVRTSPDHGTAFDIVGQGVANPGSLVAALRMAHDMADRRAT
ncbi:4-hydroxythreonine-4-phosphate dehydrogenase PdxA [Rhodobacteraceae bacterium R_SAG10]|jgi:4-hydroxythreonine-4-phosphate dehydrogenase|nr:4-hydroxythreonine-4-phosphate dehydrogenase PdxA [Rhodobacteraceae bacterium R_SAG10]